MFGNAATPASARQTVTNRKHVITIKPLLFIKSDRAISQILVQWQLEALLRLPHLQPLDERSPVSQGCTTPQAERRVMPMGLCHSHLN